MRDATAMNSIYLPAISAASFAMQVGQLHRGNNDINVDTRAPPAASVSGPVRSSSTQQIGATQVSSAKRQAPSAKCRAAVKKATGNYRWNDDGDVADRRGETSSPASRRPPRSD